MDTLNKINTLITNYNAANQALREALQTDGTLVVQEFFADLFARHPGFKRAVVFGFTPSFNDGDPCYHSCEVYVGYKNIYSGVAYYDYQDHTESEAFFTDDGEIDNPNEGCLTLKEAKKEICSWEDIFERLYDTNFIVKVQLLEDGEVSVEVDEYDCGH